MGDLKSKELDGPYLPSYVPWNCDYKSKTSGVKAVRATSAGRAGRADSHNRLGRTSGRRLPREFPRPSVDCKREEWRVGPRLCSPRGRSHCLRKGLPSERSSRPSRAASERSGGTDRGGLTPPGGRNKVKEAYRICKICLRPTPYRCDKCEETVCRRCREEHRETCPKEDRPTPCAVCGEQRKTRKCGSCGSTFCAIHIDHDCPEEDEASDARKLEQFARWRPPLA